MARILHSVSLFALTVLAQEDRIEYGHIADLATPAGKGAVASVALGVQGAGYQAIPTVAINIPGSGGGATGSGAAVTAVMGLTVIPTITAGGTGGTPGAVTLTGTDGTGTKYQVTGVISAGGVLTSLTAITVAGAYTALPGTLTAGAVSGGSLSGCTLNLTASFGVVSYTVGTAGTLYTPGAATAAVSGGTPAVAAVPGAVAITSAAGNGSAFDVTGLFPLKYSVQVTPNQDVTAFVTAKSQTGFTINVAPRLAATVLGAGTIDLIISA